MVTGINPGDNATYECDDGFTLVGGETRMCMADPANARAVWSGEDPMCFSKLSILCNVNSFDHYNNLRSTYLYCIVLLFE